MASSPGSLRRGLPRTRGGEPWPPAAAAGEALAEVEAVPAEGATPDPAVKTAARPHSAPAGTASPGEAVPVRRGLPRVRGGEPWPPAVVVPEGEHAAAPAATRPEAPPAPGALVASRDETEAVEPLVRREGEAVSARRGLPRVRGGEPWPPVVVAAPVSPSVERDDARPANAERDDARPGTPQPEGRDPQPPGGAELAREASPPAAGPVRVVAPAARAPLSFTRTVWAGEAASGPRGPAPEPRRYGPFTAGQWAGAVVVGGAGLLVVAAMAVALVRWLLSLSGMQDFVAAYPGEYHLPEGAPVGLPAWVGWQHFFNAFLIVLIIRSGLQVRREKRPAVFWSPRGDKRRKISLALWFHQSLDILWLVNGAVFVVLLFVTGQWMRIVPTSWEVFPNAVSAGLQYVSLDWPTENGWVNYNSLQQLAYFTTVFVAAPLAAITGVRMSGVWPKGATTLNRLYPVEWARAVHFPVMLYFVVFIAIHVFLVFATGALRNLNHMYAAQGSTDPAAYAGNWAGFWWFVASLVVIAGAWVAARPLVLAPIAGLFGTVKGR